MQNKECLIGPAAVAERELGWRTWAEVRRRHMPAQHFLGLENKKKVRVGVAFLKNNVYICRQKEERCLNLIL